MSEFELSELHTYSKETIAIILWQAKRDGDELVVKACINLLG